MPVDGAGGPPDPLEVAADVAADTLLGPEGALDLPEGDSALDAAVVARPHRVPAWRPMRYRDFRLLASGNAVSQLGFWAQYVAVGWVASTLTTSKFLIALSFSAQFWPSLVLAPVAGAFADRYDRRKLVMFGNLAMVAPPVVIGVLIQLHDISVLSLILLVMVGGAGQAFTQPATVALVPALVPDDEVHTAIALNAGLTSSTRVIGPSIAGLIIAAWGVAWGFHINGVSFLAVTVACMLIRVRRRPAASGTRSVVADLKTGVAYARSHPVVGRLIILVAIESFFFMHAALLPVIARQVLHGGVSTYGLLSSAPGVGFVGGAIVAASLRTSRQRRIALVAGSCVIGASFVTVGLSRSVPLTVVALGLFGLGFFAMNTTATTMLVAASEDQYRGRVMGLFTMFTAGALPINSVVAGALASALGAPATVGLCGLAIFVAIGGFCASGALRAIRRATDGPAVAWAAGRPAG
ncbi:MAG TPA: MFS transporter [Acidimicrobiales bacterium]|nr:MFS transporter [Acidimicrobiales bacterium]